MAETGQQAELELWPREHDLPPRWDGLPVQWGDWQDSPEVFICPPPKKDAECGSCGSTRAPLLNFGRMWTDPSTAPRAIGKARPVPGRHHFSVPLRRLRSRHRDGHERQNVGSR